MKLICSATFCYKNHLRCSRWADVSTVRCSRLPHNNNANIAVIMRRRLKTELFERSYNWHRACQTTLLLRDSLSLSRSFLLSPQPWSLSTIMLLWHLILIITRGQSNLRKSASRGTHSPVRGHPRGSKFVPLNSWGRVSYQCSIVTIGLGCTVWPQCTSVTTNQRPTTSRPSLSQ